MWRSDRMITGPDRATTRDIVALNRLFSDAFTDRYRRDGMHGVRVPHLNPAVWRYAIANAGEGAMVWRDARGDLLAFNLAHRSGREGWMGPLAVRQDRQGQGLGRRIVREATEWLRAGGATTIGLETMPRTVENIGFYSTLGFLPGPLTITLQTDAATADLTAMASLRRSSEDARDAQFAACRDLLTSLGGAGDYTREMQLSLEMDLGDVVLLHEGDALRGFALWHGIPLAEGRGAEDLRILKLVAVDTASALALIRGVCDAAVRLRIPHVSLRCQGDRHELYAALTRDRWLVQWTDLRMTLASYPEPETRGVVLSNWEI